MSNSSSLNLNPASPLCPPPAARGRENLIRAGILKPEPALSPLNVPQTPTVSNSSSVAKSASEAAVSAPQGGFLQDISKFFTGVSAGELASKIKAPGVPIARVAFVALGSILSGVGRVAGFLAGGVVSTVLAIPAGILTGVGAMLSLFFMDKMPGLGLLEGAFAAGTFVGAHVGGAFVAVGQGLIDLSLGSRTVEEKTATKEYNKDLNKGFASVGAGIATGVVGSASTVLGAGLATASGGTIRLVAWILSSL